MSCCVSRVDGDTPGGVSLVAEMLIDVTNSINFVSSALPIPVTLSSPALVFQGVANSSVLLQFDNSDEVSQDAYWQLRMPSGYTAGSAIVATIDVVSDGVGVAADASFSGSLERDTNFNVLGGSSFGSSVTQVAPMSAGAGVNTTFQITFTSPAQRDGILANEPFRFRLVRALLDAYNGTVYFQRGVITVSVS